MMNKGEFLGIVAVDLSTDDAVASGGGTDTISLQPPKGLCYKILGVHYYATAIGGATGTHLMKMENNFGAATDYIEYFQVEGANGGSFAVIDSQLNGSTEIPSSGTQQTPILLGSMWSTYDNPIDIVYENNSDTNQTGDRNCRIIYAVYRNGMD